MALLEYNEVREKKIISMDGEPWEVIDSHVARKQQRKPTNQVKLRSLMSGRVIEHTYQSSDTAEEAQLMNRPLTYLYTNPKNNEMWFCDPENPKDRFTLPPEIVGPQISLIREKGAVEGSIYTNPEGEEKIVRIKYPIKVELTVTDAPPGIKGDTATGGKKIATLETGAKVQVPLFINIGDTLIINTDTGEYVERAEKN